MKGLLRVMILGGIVMMSGVHANEQVQMRLPFNNGEAYECKQNSGDFPSHKSGFVATQYDLDFAMPAGTEIVASMNGVVESVHKECPTNGHLESVCGGGWGNHIVLGHENGKKTVYAHLSKNGVLVSVGQTVSTSQLIGLSGNSGKSSGAHLHFGLHSSLNKSIDGIQIYAKEYKYQLIGDEPVIGDFISEGWFSTAVPSSKSDFNCYYPSDKVGKIPGNFYQAVSPVEDVVVVENDTTEIETGFEMCFDKSYEPLTGWGKFWKSVRELFVSTASAACAQSGSIKGTVAVNEVDQTVTFTPNDSTKSPTIKVTAENLPSVSGSQINQTPTNPSTTGNPWAGYKNRIGIDYLKARFAGKSKWRPSLEVVLNEAQKIDIRAKFKQKGSIWPKRKVAVKLYLSEDQDYGNSDDIQIASKSESFPSNSKKKKSVYFEGIDLNPYLTKIGDHYLFIVTSYDGGGNSSTEDDKTERVKITVKAPEIKVIDVEIVAEQTVPVQSKPEQPSISLPSDTTTCADCQSTGLGSKEFWDVSLNNDLLEGYQPNAKGSIIIYDNLMYLTIWNPEVSESTQIFDSLMYDYQLVDVCYSDFIQTSCAPFEFQDNGMIQTKFHLPYGTAYSTKDEIMNGIKVYFAGQTITPVTSQTTITTYYTDPARFNAYLSDGRFFPAQNAVGNVSFTKTPEGGREVVLSVYDVSSLHEGGLDYPLAQTQTPFAFCVAPAYGWQTPATKEQVLNSPQCAYLPQNTASGATTGFITLSPTTWQQIKAVGNGIAVMIVAEE